MTDEIELTLCPKCGRMRVLDGFCQRCGCEVDKFERVIVHNKPNRHERRRMKKLRNMVYNGEKNKTV